MNSPTNSWKNPRWYGELPPPICFRSQHSSCGCNLRAPPGDGEHTRVERETTTNKTELGLPLIFADEEVSWVWTLTKEGRGRQVWDWSPIRLWLASVQSVARVWANLSSQKESMRESLGTGPRLSIKSNWVWNDDWMGIEKFWFKLCRTISSLHDFCKEFEAYKYPDDTRAY